MNVYVRELSSALARAGVDCDVYTRTWRTGLAPVVEVEPGFRVHHVEVGPRTLLDKEALFDLVDEFTDAVEERIDSVGPPDLIHANYWLSGISGHALKHRLGLPLVSTFHTLARVKAEDTGGEDPRRAQSEAEVVGCSDVILANSGDEAAQLERLYAAVPGRIEVVAPGVDHGAFGPGDRSAARSSLGLGKGPTLLFVGRIQPLKGVDIAMRAMAALAAPDATLVVVGGPSGPDGQAELDRVHRLADELGVGGRVRFVAPKAHRLLARWYQAADVCLVPSRSESFGLVALEAAACGTPVVAAAVGGLRTLVAHGSTGFLVEGRDPAVFAAYVDELLANPLLAAEMSVNAAARAGNYRWSMSAARLRRLYSDLTARQLVECAR